VKYQLFLAISTELSLVLKSRGNLHNVIMPAPVARGQRGVENQESPVVSVDKQTVRDGSLLPGVFALALTSGCQTTGRYRSRWGLKQSFITAWRSVCPAFCLPVPWSSQVNDHTCPRCGAGPQVSPGPTREVVLPLPYHRSLLP